MKKTLTITMIVILLLNLIYIPSFAATDEEGNLTKIETSPQENGNVEITNKNGKTNKASVMGTDYSNAQNGKTVALVLTAFPRWVNLVLNAFVDNMTNGDKDSFTIYDTIMGKYDLFNISFTENAIKRESSTEIITIIKSNVLKYYAFTRAISISLSLFVLIYIGIRMAISTVASDRARYKKMLVNWVVALVLVFLMHILIITISYVLQMFMDLVGKIASWDAFNGVNSFEEGIYGDALKGLNTSKGFNVFAAAVLIYVMTWYQVKFFFYYLHRTLEVNFLVIISPLVTITYPIDKIGDGRAQAFSKLMREIIMKSAIQVVHAFLYIVFVATAGLVAKSQPILAVVFFAALSRSEKIARNVFGVDEKGFERFRLDILNKIPFLNR